MPGADATHPLVSRLARRHAGLAVLSDYDGSLAPVVEDPEAAVALPGALGALGRLVPLVRRVGVVSGRAVDFLASRVTVPGVELAGQHGLEYRQAGVRTVDAVAIGFAERMSVAAAEAEVLLPGIRVERKGASLTLHWRGAPGRGDEVQQTAADLAARHGLALLHGRLIVELRPPVRADKGTAVEAFAAGCSAAVFAGDDDSDLAAFGALDRLVDAGSLLDAVRVAVLSPEAPEALISAADMVVEGPAGLARLLGSLADAIVQGVDAASPRGSRATLRVGDEVVEPD